MKLLKSPKILSFTMSCIANAKPSRELHPNMQIFKTCFDMPLDITDFNTKWDNKIQRWRRNHLYDLGNMAVYGKKNANDDFHTMSGAVEQLGRLPKETDGFYFEYFVSGDNYFHRFLKIDERDDKKGDLLRNIRPMRRAIIFTECHLILNK